MLNAFHTMASLHSFHLWIFLLKPVRPTSMKTFQMTHKYHNPVIITVYSAQSAAAKSPQSCPTLCDPTDGSPPGSLVPGILQAKHWSGLPLPSPMHESEK